MTYVGRVLGEQAEGSKIKSKEDFAKGLQHQHTFPGGYPTYFVCQDGGALCFDCAKKNKKEIDEAIESKADPQWQVVHQAVNWEDGNLTCDHCDKKIESAYAED